MSVELKIPTVGESITEALISQWFKKVGDYVQADEPVAELETDKVTLELPAPVAGVLTEISVAAGETAAIGDVIGKMDDTAAAPAALSSDQAASAASKEEVAVPPSKAASDVQATPPPAAPPGAPGHVMPAAQRLVQQNSLDATAVAATGPGGRLLKEDVQRHLAAGAAASSREQERVKMTPIRKRIAERLVSAQQGAALLTTFNEIDMSAVLELRKQYKEGFLARHGVKLGFMSFFVKASIDALRQFPKVNAQIDGDDIVFNNYFDVGVAVSTDRGLMVPNVRNAERLSFAEIEATIADFGQRGRAGKIQMSDLEGGTFTISNGGVFGSLLSTPIINPPQSGVLGLHSIQQRPIALDGEVVIRPMMYVALTYDHRMVDGKEAVSFLKRIKETIEDPTRILLEA